MQMFLRQLVLVPCYLLVFFVLQQRPFALLSSVWPLQVVRTLDIFFCCPSISRMVDTCRPSSELQCLPISRIPIYAILLLKNNYAQPRFLLANPPPAFLVLLPFLPPGVTLPEHTALAYMLGIGRRVNFKFTLRCRFSSRTQFCHYFFLFFLFFI